MLREYLAGILAILLAVMFSLSTFAQDVKKEMKKETKPAVEETKKEVKKEVKSVVAVKPKTDQKKSTKPPTMKFVSCNQTTCGFWAKSHSAKELRYLMKRHSKRYHKIVLTDLQVKDMVKKEGTK